jgi:outer membrane receptor protein involved in Fe transport
MRVSVKNCILYGASIISASLALSQVSHAQTAPAPGSDSEVAESEGADIIVTASKRGDSTVMDIPMSITAIGAVALQQRGATEFNDFVKLVPGLSISDQGSGNKRYVLRGISSAGAGTVGVYLDEIVLTGENDDTGGGRQPDPRLYDLERVEVLKGPQGTTFGSSALSGVVRYIINKPDLDKFGGTIRAAISDQHLAGVGGNFDMTANIPIVTDRLGVRASVFVQGKPGYIDNRYEKGVNTDETFSGRLQVRFRPSDSATLDLFYQYQHTDAGLNYYNDVNFAGVAVPRYQQVGPERQSFEDSLKLLNATFNYDTGIGTVTATATHTERKTTYTRPGSQALGGAAHLPPEDPSVRSVMQQPRTSKVDAFELRFASDWGGPLQLLTGVYYQKDNRDFTSRVLTVNANGYIDGIGGIFGPVLQDRRLFTKIEEKAAFGELTWDITDKLHLIGGLRAFEFNTMSQPNVPQGVLGRPGTGPGPVSRAKVSSVIGRGNLSYDFTSDTKIYAQVAQGYRPGGTNDQSAAALAGATVPEGFAPDDLINYEVGIKHMSADRRFSMALTGYYVDWSNIQLSLRTPANAAGQRYPYTGNAGKARIYGLEGEVTARVGDGFRLSASGAYTNATVRESLPNAGNRGDRIPYTPRWSGTVTADYDFQIGGSKANIGADASYVGDRATDFPNTGVNYIRLDDYITVGAHAGVQMGNKRVSLIVRNLLDDDTVYDKFLLLPPVTVNGSFRNPPRTISLEFGLDF